MGSLSHTERSDDSHAFIPTAVTASPDGRPAAAGPAATSSTSRPDLVGSRPPSTAQAMLHSPPPAASARLVARENKEVENDELKQTAARLLGLDNGARPKLAAATPGAAGGSSSQGSTTGKQLPAILGLGPPPVLTARQPLRQTSSSSAIPLSSPSGAAGNDSATLSAASELPARAPSALPTPPSANIFAIPVKPFSPLCTPSPGRPRRRTIGRSPIAGSSSATSSRAAPVSMGPPLSIFGTGTAKDITLDEDPFAPSTATSARHAAVMSSAGSTPGCHSTKTFDSDSSTSDSEDEPFPYPHHLRTRQNHTLPYPSGHGSPSSAAAGPGGVVSHRHQASLPQDFVFSSPMSSSSGGSSSNAPDPDSTLPHGSSPQRPPVAQPPPSHRGSALPKRSFARSISQPERSNILERPPAFNSFVPDLPSYREASVSGSTLTAHPSNGMSRAKQPSERVAADGASSRHRIPGARATSLTMQRAQREALEEREEQGRTALATPPAVSSPPLPAPDDERLGQGEVDARSTATTSADERHELLIRPLGLLALSQALSAANDEVATLRSTVRETASLVVDQAYWLTQAAGAVQAQGGLAPPPPSEASRCNAKELAEIDELSGTEAREALKIVASTTTKSLVAISLVRTIHALVHSGPAAGVERIPPTEDDVEIFTDENLSMLEGTLVAWRRMAHAGVLASMMSGARDAQQ